MNRPITPAPPRRSTLVLLTGILAMLALSLLLSSRPARPARAEYRILCSFLPVYVFALNVVGDAPGVDVDVLLSPDLGCPHEYALRPRDVVRANAADLVVLNGLGAEPFADKLVSGRRPGEVMTISDDAETIPLTPDDEEGAGHDHQGGHQGHRHGPVNPHVWASPAQAARQVRTLARKLAEADPPRAARYRANGEAYARRLEALADRMRAAAQSFRGRAIVTFHDAFAYLARDLDLRVAATLTVDPQGNLSAARMAELMRIIREQHVAAVFYEPAYSGVVARTLAEQTGVPAFPLNPFNYAAGRPDAGAYERVMEENLRTLQRALGDGS